MTSIGVVIVSFNTCELLRGCLESLRACALPLRVVVVENGSRDDSAAMTRACFPEAELIELDHNVGFAAGTNIGIQGLGVRCREAQPMPNTQHPTPDYILLLNPDTIVHPGAIEALAAFLDAHPRVGAVGPRLLNSDGSLQPAAFRFPTLSMSVLDLFPPGEALPGRLYNSWWHGRYPCERDAEQPFPIDHPLGACILARRAVVEQVGMLDERFFMYAEEIDWCYRIRQAGWSIWQEPRARVTHVGGAATSQFRSRMLIALYDSRLRFFRKHYRSGFIRWNMWIVRAGMLRAALLAWRDYARGRLGGDELRARLWAYGEVMRAEV
ncbi:MAG TPA: glycosyltransferase family 2 protein [Roseiflexaceae bacterium]|nr:glycosyltransferase family 2 protein [Roseiflexaceae bacterium]